jgi:3-deoxy-manno-octulosonate cytidylyltransferase (CMP-KDO synthetase)
MKVIALIPARLAATRLPRKPLLPIAGKPMIQWVWEKATSVETLDGVYVATPDVEIFDAVEAFGGKAIMTSDRHQSGTDRLAEAAETLDADIIVNIQGDEPLIDPDSILLPVNALLDNPDIPMASLMCPCPEMERDNPACVKVVCDRFGNALFFSRYGIPYQRNPDPETPVFQHVGLYVYRRDFLLLYSQMERTPLERIEGLEQLRVLENGYKIRMCAIEKAPLSVDTPEDMEGVEKILRQLK